MVINGQRFYGIASASPGFQSISLRPEVQLLQVTASELGVSRELLSMGIGQEILQVLVCKITAEVATY